jgi:hypothetical protein
MQLSAMRGEWIGKVWIAGLITHHQTKYTSNQEETKFQKKKKWQRNKQQQQQQQKCKNKTEIAVLKQSSLNLRLARFSCLLRWLLLYDQEKYATC